VVPTTDWIGHPVVERQHQIFERLATRHEVHVLRFRYYDERNLDTHAVVHEINDNMVHSIAIYYLINTIKHYNAIKEIVDQNRIDVVVLSNLLPAYTSVKALSKKVPTIFDLSDHFPSSATGYVFNVRSIFGKLSCYTLDAMLKHILSKVDCTVACSYPLRLYAERLDANGNTALIPNGVEEFFLTQKHAGDTIRNMYNLDEAIVIGYVGMIEFWVNMSPLLQAIKKLSRTREVKLFLIGKRFQTNTHQKLLREIKELKISENVVWSEGWVPYKKLPNYIAAMDLCAIPFDHTHPTGYFSAPNKLWEYLAVGRPVITTQLPDVFIQAGQYVNFVETYYDYIKIIEDYIRDPEKYIEKTRKSQKIIKNHTWNKISRTYERLLESIDINKK
jgi:phosphatidylinositol alpha-1,6-mannosyltransferase